MFKHFKKSLGSLFLGSLLLAGCAAGGSATKTEGAGTKAGEVESKTSQGGGTGQLEKVTFLLDWTPNTNHTGLFVAKEKGYFKEEGLDVTIQTPPQAGAASLVGAGKAEFGIDAQDTMAPALTADKPLPVTAIAAILQHNTSGLISRKGEGLSQPKGLEGKKYATWDNPVEQAMIKHLVEKDGGDFSKVKLIPNNITNEVAALKAKQADAIWIFYGWSGINAEKENFPFDFLNFRELEATFDYYTPVIVTSEDMLKNRPETVKKFLKAVAKGYEESAKDPEGSAKMLLKNAPELEEGLVLASQKYLSKQYVDGSKPWGTIEPERWNAFYRWLNENKLVPKPLAENQGFNNDYLPGK